MQLHVLDRRYYTLDLATNPPDLTWRASFDGGTTFIDAERVDTTGRRWLIAGPQAAPGAAVAVVTGDTVPLLEVVDNPELEHPLGVPAIYVWS